jgi:serine/threonine-protein kinase
MGEVFLAHDAVLARQVAIKVLHRSLAGDQAFVDRFRREARAAASLSHPNIVAVYDWGSVDGIYYMVMEYVRGRSARDLLNAQGSHRLQPAQAGEVVRQTLLALEHAHRQGIVHRDVKPENVLVTVDGVVKVADFGLARAFADGRATQTGAVQGTVQYLSPEQIRGEPADPRSDLYALGVVTYELLTGRLPFTGETAMSIAYKHLSNRVPAPSSTVPQIPDVLDGFVLSATDRDRELRPESAAEMRRDLESIQRELPPSPPLATLVQDLPEDSTPADATEPERAASTVTIPRLERTKRRRLRKVVGVVLALAALTTAAWGVWAYVIPREADVPQLAGVAVDEARARLDELGFAVRLAAGEYSLVYGDGDVISVQPRPGTTLEEGRMVTLVPSLGPPPVPVPDVTGMTVQKAETALRDADLTMGEPQQAFDFDVPAGHVISQDPATGTAPQGSAVDLVVSEGPPPRPVPAVVGEPEDQATKALQNAGFNVTVDGGFSSKIPAGQVIRQHPAGDADAPAGSMVRIVVSLGPRIFPCPDLRGLSVEEARTTAAGYGLELAALPVAGATGTTVVTQVPNAGTDVRYGATITVYYA